MKAAAILSLLSVAGLVSAAPASNVPPREVLVRDLPVVDKLPVGKVTDKLPLGEVTDKVPVGKALGGIGRRQNLEQEVEGALTDRNLPLDDRLPLGQALGALGRRHDPHEHHDHPEHHRGSGEGHHDRDWRDDPNRGPPFERPPGHVGEGHGHEGHDNGRGVGTGWGKGPSA
ncbi:hypothetical protein ETB97_006308 [Aspergillus alliaceus]|uniref:Uncharacterized protein n=1 Tax=Petromyces alliaceus TaxID=209559 RepID=A0A8H5ZXG9_PETAA|nr:hypothetical protein ETB97_006308 [Aspergillus burnettii]